MRVRIITRDVAHFPQKDWERVNHQTDPILLWGNQPVPRGFVTVFEMPPDWKPREWRAEIGSISIAEPSAPVPASIAEIETPTWLRRIDAPPEVPPAEIPIQALAGLPKPKPPRKLSDKEARIHRLHEAGLDYDAIAVRLELKGSTVRKLAQLARSKVRAGAVVPPESSVAVAEPAVA